ncbi:CHASE2 domain-containing protein [Symplocastrum sp. BBK-W-15]|uniref:CHASE2 domain-containing protein n=1 Tax=Limnofasciculus baicalensis BBK-W-15 TaxID=2699891 RepID=A0AAE3GSF7_9CYAN|nr:CHASE2 domain-containing protein [Limnofasciculus baicalensis]MCP2729429.1 CHASE2 domain-containing protein [Limnofasciculus baicalensis BBK-W-15]
MNTKPNSNYRYQIGGSLPSDSPTYVVRQADSDLFNALLNGEYCYVLNSRQMGKSSLRIQTMCNLQKQGITCAEIELNGIGSQQITAQQWYGGIIQELISGFDLQVNRRSWLREREDLSPVQRLGEFIETVLLEQIPQNLVIFIDEIDSVLGLSFPTDDFFALIRNCYDKRGTKLDYRRLTFALLGVATPSDLIQDKNSTPFNIGKAIELRGFQIQESAALAEGFTGIVSNPQSVLIEVLNWTGGQPFLTQKLCRIIANYSSQERNNISIIYDAEEARWVEELVQNQIIENWESHDEPEHIRTIRDRILRNSRSTKQLLLLYKEICEGGRIIATNSPEHIELRLSGLVKKQEGYLVVSNPIYELVFNLDWIESNLTSLNSISITNYNPHVTIDNNIDYIDNNVRDISTKNTTPLPHFREDRVLAAIVFTDVESFTKKMVTDEQHTLELVHRDFQLMNQICQEFEGQILKSLGDGLLMYFASVEKAVSSSIAMQKAIATAATNLPESDILRHRIGIHLGEVFFNGNDVMGNGVNMAARLQTQAIAGGICLSQTVYDVVKNTIKIDARYGGLRSLKNIPEPVPVYEIPPPQERELPVRSFIRKWRSCLSVLAASAIASSLVIGMRSLGFLQVWELKTFDQLMQLRPNEELDERFLIITITEKDVQAQPPQERVGASLSDRSLDQLLAKLESYQPIAVGLDIYRDRPVNPAYRDLATRMAKNERFFSICNYGDPGVIPPPEVPGERQGFNNVILDPDEVIRRHILAVGSASPCQNQYSFSWQILTYYLAQKKIEPKLTSDGYLQLGSIIFKTLGKNTASYHNIDSSGHQILLNYRANRQVSHTISMTDFLNGKFNPNLVNNRIVLIGTTAPSFNDNNWRIPDSRVRESIQTTTGVEIQAHMISQILSAVLDNRPLLWWWPKSGETIWICGWCLVGGIVFSRYRSLLGLLIRGGIVTIVLYGSCWILFLQGGWVPLIPAALALVIAGGCVMVFDRF